MKCRNCGAVILDTDEFCAQCGCKVVKERRCPDCATVLREGTKFCHKCGRLVAAFPDRTEAEPERSVMEQETIDMPIADIEKNILLETEHEIGAIKRKSKEAPKIKVKKEPLKETVAKSKPEKAAKKVYEEEWDDEEDEEETENENNIMKIISVVMAFLIFAVAAFLIFAVIRKQPVKEYGKNVEVVQDTENGTGESSDNVEAEDSMQPIGTLSIVSNVNVRDNPSTQGTNIIKVAKAGETYEYFGRAEDDDWYIILLEDGTVGYVFKDYVSAE